ARLDRSYALRPHSFVRATQGLVLSRLSLGSRTELLGCLEPCLPVDVAFGSVRDGDGRNTRMARAGSAHAGTFLSGLARGFGDATCPAKPVAAWREGSGARF